ncbi:MAG: DUF3108 domain-containing protein [Candidatus Omnitrophica bacterium]|nr:DUF3108 domain-containing protein [Candidatus Omnitrophota bacterium]
MISFKRLVPVLSILALQFALHTHSYLYAHQEGPDGKSFSAGERILYNLEKFGVNVGKASIEFHGTVQKESRSLVYIRFLADGLNFYDEEKIYLDPETYLPQIVERDVDIFGKKEKIREEYFHSQDYIQITKHSKGDVTRQEFPVKGPVENLYGFIYRYRREGAFEVGAETRMNLPTQDVFLSIVAKEPLKVNDHVYETYFFKGQPKRVRVWFEDSQNKFPVRIDGTLGLLKAKMTFISVEKFTP